MACRTARIAHTCRAIVRAQGDTPGDVHASVHPPCMWTLPPPCMWTQRGPAESAGPLVKDPLVEGSEVDHVSCEAVEALLQCLRQCRVRVHVACQLQSGEVPFLCEREL